MTPDSDYTNQPILQSAPLQASPAPHTTGREDTIIDTFLKTIPPLHPEGRKFVAIFAAVTIILFVLWAPLGWLGVVLTLWCAYFFRDPIRMIPAREGLILSPADGLVQKIVKTVPPAVLKLGGAERTRISIFLNVFDVHVNRIPAAGTVTALNYHPGAFFNASLDKASEENERQHITITLNDNRMLGVVQIAGLVARRILCTLREGQTVMSGERLGLIRFGSRVDVYLPEGVAPLVIVGQRAVGGETILADFKSTEAPRAGMPI